MSHRKRLMLFAVVIAVALLATGAGTHSATESQMDRGSGITVESNSNALIAINDDEITNHFPMGMEIDVSEVSGDLVDSPTTLSAGETGVINVNGTTTVDIQVTGSGTAAVIEDVVIPDKSPPETPTTPSENGVDYREHDCGVTLINNNGYPVDVTVQWINPGGQNVTTSSTVGAESEFYVKHSQGQSEHSQCFAFGEVVKVVSD